MTQREEFSSLVLKELGIEVSFDILNRAFTVNGSSQENTLVKYMWISWSESSKAQAAPESVTPKESMIPVKDDDLVLVPRGILGAARSAIYKKLDAPILLSKLRELSMSVGAMRAAPEQNK